MVLTPDYILQVQVAALPALYLLTVETLEVTRGEQHTHYKCTLKGTPHQDASWTISIQTEQTALMAVLHSVYGLAG